MTNDRPQVYFSRSQVTLVRGLWMLITAVLALMTLFPLLWMVSIAFKPATESFSSMIVRFIVPLMASNPEPGRSVRAGCIGRVSPRNLSGQGLPSRHPSIIIKP